MAFLSHVSKILNMAERGHIYNSGHGLKIHFLFTHGQTSSTGGPGPKREIPAAKKIKGAGKSDALLGNKNHFKVNLLTRQPR